MIDLRIQAEQLGKKLSLTMPQVQKAMAVTLTKAAYNVQEAVQREMRSQFDRPTPFVMRSVFVRQAKVQGNDVTPAIIGIRGGSESAQAGPGGVQGSGKVTPAHALYAQIAGGKRRDKGSEELLKKVMPQGMDQWVRASGAPDDGHGNLSGPLVKQIVAAMQAGREAGFTSNAGIRGTTGLTRKQASNIKILRSMQTQGRGRDNLVAREIERIKQERRERNTKRQVNTFFLGKPKGGNDNSVLYQFDWMEQPGKRRPNNPNPAPVWKKGNLRPVVVFTPKQSYKQRLPFFELGRRLASQDMPRILEQETMRLFAKWNQYRG